MSNLQALEARLAELETERGKITDKMVLLKGEIASLRCPFKLGDRVSAGMVHKGRVLQITKIFYRDYGEGYALLGRLVRKDGALGVDEFDIWQLSGLKLENTLPKQDN